MLANKKTVILIIGLIILISILVVINFTRKAVPPTPQSSLPPIVKFTPKDLNMAPRTADQAINLQSQEVVNSQAEINKIKTKLPLEETFTATNGIESTILIPASEFQDSEWTLTILINGIDYQVPVEEEANSKQAFLESTQKVFNWLESQGADPSKIYIVWGDKKFIQDKATEWLKP